MAATLPAIDTATLGLVVAFGCGLLVGIERERRKGQGPRRAAAGLRTFAVVAACGGVAQWLDVPGLVLAGAALVAALAIVAYLRSTQGEPAPDGDPGLTTEIALFATYLVGVLAVRSPALGAGCGVALAALLAARARLHLFATQWLSESELHDGLLLAALALIMLPLVPAGPLPQLLGGIRLQPLAFLVVLILALQAAAHVALRLLGERGGLLLGGFLSGFVSSTATVATMGRRARRAASPTEERACAAGAGMSAAATWVLAVVVVGALAPGLAPLIAAPAGLAALVAAATAWSLLRLGASRTEGAPAPTPTPASAAGSDPEQVHEPAPEHAPDLVPGSAGPAAAALLSTAPQPVPQTRASASAPGSRQQGPLRLREAVAVAALLFGISAAVAALTGAAGQTAALPGTALAALADAHAAVAAIASLVHSGTLPPSMLGWGLLVAIGTNTLSRLVVAAATGGGPFAARLAWPLLASLVAASAVVAATSGLQRPP